MIDDELARRRQKKCGDSSAGHSIARTGGVCMNCGYVIWHPALDTPPPDPPPHLRRSDT